MTRRATVLAGIGAALVVTLLGFAVLRRLEFFRVRQIELVGLRYHAPQTVVAGMGLRDGQSVFDPVGDVEARVAAIRGVVGVEVERRLPGTLRVRVAEQVPVAFVSGPEGMVALDAHAHPLPYDAMASGIDLPVVSRPDSVVTGVLGTVSVTAPLVFREIDTAERHPDGGVVMRSGPRRIVLRAAPSVEDIAAVDAVRRHLLEGGGAFAELDGRYEGMVIVRGSNG